MSLRDQLSQLETILFESREQLHDGVYLRACQCLNVGYQLCTRLENDLLRSRQDLARSMTQLQSAQSAQSAQSHGENNLAQFPSVRYVTTAMDNNSFIPASIDEFLGTAVYRPYPSYVHTDPRSVRYPWRPRTGHGRRKTDIHPDYQW